MILSSDDLSHTRAGYTVQDAITDEWSLRTELRYSDLGFFIDPVLAWGFGTVRCTETEQRV